MGKHELPDSVREALSAQHAAMIEVAHLLGDGVGPNNAENLEEAQRRMAILEDIATRVLKTIEQFRERVKSEEGKIHDFAASVLTDIKNLPGVDLE